MAKLSIAQKKEMKRRKWEKIFFPPVMFVTVMVTIAIALLILSPLFPLVSYLFTPESIAAKEIRLQQEQNSETAFVARGMVRNVLMDGESARFDSFRMGKANSICGRVNAKNA